MVAPVVKAPKSKKDRKKKKDEELEEAQREQERMMDAGEERREGKVTDRGTRA